MALNRYSWTASMTSCAPSRKSRVIKFALPAGDLRPSIADLLDASGLRVDGYGEGSRSYRLSVPSLDHVTVRVFREKDIPVQVALGNYDLGICGLGWVTEIQARFKQRVIVPLCDLGAGSAGIYAAASASSHSRLDDLASLDKVRIASDYPNLAEAFALAARLPSYRVQPVWGAAEAYPPEDADCIVVSAADEESLRRHGLAPLSRLLNTSAWLIGNASALADRDLSAVLTPLASRPSPAQQAPRLNLPSPITNGIERVPRSRERDVLRMAVPDGHQQRHVAAALRDAGLYFEGYDDGAPVRRPGSSIDGLEVKVIRPHDMPALVATGEMDIAITGRDCLMEHRYSFPTSPAIELLDLQRGQYNLSAVVSQDVPASTIHEALEYWRARGRKVLRLASEFPATADHYARSRHFWRYQVISIAGASEGFVPEDADLLIEGTETGKTLAENNLKAIDLLYRSTTCVIGRKDDDLSGPRHAVYDRLMAALQQESGSPDSV